MSESSAESSSVSAEDESKESAEACSSDLSSAAISRSSLDLDADCIGTSEDVVTRTAFHGRRGGVAMMSPPTSFLRLTRQKRLHYPHERDVTGLKDPHDTDPALIKPLGL